MTWLARIVQALASIAGIDVAGAAIAAELRQKIVSLQAALDLSTDTLRRRDAIHAAVVAEKDRQLEELRAYLRDAAVRDPAGVLDRLLAGEAGPKAVP